MERWVRANEVETKRKESLLPKVDGSGYPWIKAGECGGFEYLRA